MHVLFVLRFDGRHGSQTSINHMPCGSHFHNPSHSLSFHLLAAIYHPFFICLTHEQFTLDSCTQIINL
ncbi:hypothetical protein L1987_00771 [Smallanthus sonchifolius]|uniref:Uncharacterized protein n=1 Tax=Smallanthus sonchifolius TaxID=185202 RepID=A0ACB9K375_9ASTR|nr:hypothetical protein L1987_00771 [Smallanthus sonchifolius]